MDILIEEPEKRLHPSDINKMDIAKGQIYSEMMPEKLWNIAGMVGGGRNKATELQRFAIRGGTGGVG